MTQQPRVPLDAAQDAEPTVGALVHQLAEEIPELVRSEIRLAQAEVTEKGKRVGAGLGLFGAAVVFVFFGFATLIATAVLALTEVIPGWAAALIVAAALLLPAGLLALLGKTKVSSGQPLKPERAAAGVQEDLAILREVRP